MSWELGILHRTLESSVDCNYSWLGAKGALTCARKWRKCISRKLPVLNKSRPISTCSRGSVDQLHPGWLKSDHCIAYGSDSSPDPKTALTQPRLYQIVISKHMILCRACSLPVQFWGLYCPDSANWNKSRQDTYHRIWSNNIMYFKEFDHERHQPAKFHIINNLYQSTQHVPNS